MLDDTMIKLIAIWIFVYIFQLLPGPPEIKWVIDILGLVLVILLMLWPALRTGH